MGTFKTRRALAAGAFLAIAAILVCGTFWLTFASALDRMEERGRAELSLASGRLTGQLQRVRDLAVFLSDHPGLAPLAMTGRGDVGLAEGILQEMSDRTSAFRLALADNEGRVIAASGDWPASVAERPYFQRAMDGALGAFRHVESASGRRVFTYAAPMFSADGPVAGAVLASADVAAFERNWPSGTSAVIFTDLQGVVFSSNRSEFVLSKRFPGHPLVGRSGDFSGVELAQFPSYSARIAGTREFWSMQGGRYLPARALRLEQPLPVVGMTGEILLDLSPALTRAIWQAIAAAAICMAFGSAVFWFAERRRRLAGLLAAEAKANARLEARVAARTAELAEANADLTREIGERSEAEAALRKAQEDLVQAGKLSVLGQISAGIGHEMNQPLMAVRSFAENAKTLIARGRHEQATENLGRISELARRMGRIVANLRTFARPEPEAIADVDLVEAVDAALEMLGPNCARAGVEVDWRRPNSSVIVRGGEVRLQQVIMNLVSNAVDATKDRPEKRVKLEVTGDGGRVRLSVLDTGAGIAEPDRVFDPFYTTKEVEGSDGMGLGLSISSKLVRGFGGVLRGRNLPEGGAEFYVELLRAGKGDTT